MVSPEELPHLVYLEFQFLTKWNHVSIMFGVGTCMLHLTLHSCQQAAEGPALAPHGLLMPMMANATSGSGISLVRQAIIILCLGCYFPFLSNIF